MSGIKHDVLIASDTVYNSIQPNISAVCLCVALYSPMFVRDSAVLLRHFPAEKNTETLLDCSCAVTQIFTVI